MFTGASIAPVISKVICMFTGIIEAVGTLAELRRQGEDMALTVHAPTLDFSDVKLGDSIATNGVCLTVVALGDHSYTADVSWKPSPAPVFLPPRWEIRSTSRRR